MSARLFHLTKIFRFDKPTRTFEAELTWEEWLQQVINHGFADPGPRTTAEGKGDLPGFCPLAFKESAKQTRAVDVKRVSVLMLDFDEDPDKDMIEQCFTGWKYFAHTTINNSERRAKWRIMLPLSEDITDENFLQVWRWAEQRCADYGLIVDGSAKDIGRKWAYPYKRTPDVFVDNPYDELWGEGTYLEPSKCKAQQKIQMLAEPVYGHGFIRMNPKDIPLISIGPTDTVETARWLKETKIGSKLRCYCPLLEADQRNSVGAVMFRTSRGITIKCGATHHAKHLGHPLFVKIDDPQVSGDPRPTFDQAVWQMLEKKQDKQGNVGNPLPSKYNLLTILEHDPYLKKELWFNEFNSRPIYNGVPLTDETSFEVLVWVERAYQTTFPDNIFNRALKTVLAKRRHNPLQEWAAKLTWDKTNRVTNFAARALGNDDPFSNMLFARWLVQAAARMLQPGIKADSVVILQGPQGIGKSTALAYLAGPEYFSDTVIDMENRQGYIQVQAAWIHELGELATMRKSEISAIKAFITKVADKFVAPYGKEITEVLRKCVFAGTTNENEFLLDDTGNRRWLPIRCINIDLEWIRTNRDQIWAQACEMYHEGYKYWLDDGELKELSVNQEVYRERAPWEDAVTLWLKKNTPSLKVFRQEEVLRTVLELDLKHQQRAMQIALGKFLKKLGCEKFQLWIPELQAPITYYRTQWTPLEDAMFEAKKLHGLIKEVA